MSDWSDLPASLYVVSAKRDDVVWSVWCCSVPMVTAPEVRYVRADFGQREREQHIEARAEIERLREAMTKAWDMLDCYDREDVKDVLFAALTPATPPPQKGDAP